jgi:hypothetical protein
MRSFPLCIQYIAPIEKKRLKVNQVEVGCRFPLLIYLGSASKTLCTGSTWCWPWSRYHQPFWANVTAKHFLIITKGVLRRCTTTTTKESLIHSAVRSRALYMIRVQLTITLQGSGASTGWKIQRCSLFWESSNGTTCGA